jgi:iron complex outermembrane recepter protein
MLGWLLLAAFAQAQCADCESDSLLPAVVSEERRQLETARDPERARQLDLEALARKRALTDIAEALSELPGVIARERGNEAQDTQIQIRGFGARTPFGVRGLRIEYDGIPATAADGQSQIGHLDLASGGRMTLIRGPFAALYGNGGGYLRIDRAKAGSRQSADRLHAASGSSGQRRLGFDVDYGEQWRFALSGNRYETDGERRQSAAERTLARASMDWQAGDSGLLSLTADYQDQPDSSDPQGLTRAEFARDPNAASPSALLFDTRKSTRQSQFGARYQQDFGDSELSFAGYVGVRSIDQVLSVPRAAQLAPGNGGGIVALDRDYHGWSVRWSRRATLTFAEAEFSAEWRDERLSEERRGYENFVGDQLGVRGALRRDERNGSVARDGILRIDLDPNDQLRLSAGVRHSDTRYDSRDRYVAPGNPDDSGVYLSAAWLPVIGASYRLDESWVAHGSLGRTQELPTLAELAYRDDGDGGFNSALKPARGRQAEVGVQYAADRLQAELTAFQVEMTDEIVVANSQGGRTSFQNAGATRRRGLEWAGNWNWSPQWRLQGVANWIDARYTQGYSTCRQLPCTAPIVNVAAGRRLPGVPPRSARLELSWQVDASLDAALEWQALAATPASDRNHDVVPGYAVCNARLGHRFRAQPWGRLSALLRVDNLLDRRYSGSVIVNEGAARYFEAAPGRGFWLGLDLALP